MYNALIVDDEKSILENIQKAIPWDCLLYTSDAADD